MMDCHLAALLDHELFLLICLGMACKTTQWPAHVLERHRLVLALHGSACTFPGITWETLAQWSGCLGHALFENTASCKDTCKFRRVRSFSGIGLVAADANRAHWQRSLFGQLTMEVRAACSAERLLLPRFVFVCMDDLFRLTKLIHFCFVLGDLFWLPLFLGFG